MNIYRDIFVDFWVMQISSTRFTVIFLNKKLKSLKSHFSYIIFLTHLSPAQPRKKCKKCQKKPCNLTTLWANYYLFSFNRVFHPTKLAGDYYYYYYLWVSCSGSKASKASWLYTIQPWRRMKESSILRIRQASDTIQKGSRILTGPATFLPVDK